MRKAAIRDARWFHLVDPADLTTLEDWAQWLEAILHNPCAIFYEDDGSPVLINIKALVHRVNGLRIEVYPNEHGIPHFHVKSPNVDAKFAIEDCRLIEGEISRADRSKVKYWHARAKPLLVQRWNETRPTDCVVGPYGTSPPRARENPA